MTKHCPSCAKRSVGASGSKASPVLMLGEFPGKEELQNGKPFVGPAGGVLRKELAKLEVDLFQFRCTNLWLHEPNKNENCFKASLDACLSEAIGKQAILLIGSDAVSYFTEYKVSDVNGLQVDSPMLSAPIIYACLNPAIVFHKTVGELRFALTNFVERIREEGLI